MDQTQDAATQRAADRLAADQASAKVTADEAAAKASAEEAGKANPARDDGHEHKFVSGLAPGGKQLRICTVPGCGLTEGL